MYRVIPDTEVFDQIAAAPAELLPLIAEAFALLALAPRSGRPYNDDLPDGPMRELVVGADHHATITYLTLEHPPEVHVLVIQWVN